jgi:acyl-CoA synthetase (AMP-forming)/AMP-acid ligase II
MDPIAAQAQANPEKVAIVDDDGTIVTYAELNAEVNRLAHGLRALGLGVGTDGNHERAVWCGPNSRQVVTFLHAARKIGLVAVPAAYRFTAEELQYLADNSDSVLVVVDAEHAAKFAEVRDRLPKVREIVVFGGEAFDGARNWDDVTRDQPTDEPELARGGGATMIYTSGTTGKPKGAMRTRQDPDLAVAVLQKLRLQPNNEVHITTGPLYHSGPLAWASFTHTLGGTMILMRHFDAERWVDLVREHKVTNTFTAPTQLKRIVALPDEVLARADLSSMRSLVANAAPVPYSLKQEIIAKLGDHFLFEVYGSTELGIDCVLEPEDQLRKPGSCGKPYASIEVKVVDENGNTQPTGEPGELYVRTTGAFDGYHATTEKVGELASGPAGDEHVWKSVGDVAYLDEEGFVYICDRRKDMIISGGVNIHPAEIEAVLHAHPDVMDAAVFGIPSDEWGESVHAVVAPRPGHTIDVASLEEHAAVHLAGYKRPRSWEVRDSLPRTESGKLLKRVLRDEHWAGRDQKV